MTIKLVGIGGLGLMLSPSAKHLKAGGPARFLRIHDRGTKDARRRSRNRWQRCLLGGLPALFLKAALARVQHRSRRVHLQGPPRTKKESVFGRRQWPSEVVWRRSPPFWAAPERAYFLSCSSATKSPTTRRPFFPIANRDDSAGVSRDRLHEARSYKQRILQRTPTRRCHFNRVRKTDNIRLAAARSEHYSVLVRPHV